jgi:Sec-independent protein secretion pathway component TatC
MSQMIVTVPLVLLYEFSIILSKRVYRIEEAKMRE